MIIIKSTVSILHINEGINKPCRGDYSMFTDKKWLKFCKDHNLKGWDTSSASKWYHLYLMLCAEGLL